MRDVSFCQATNWVDTTYLRLHTYFQNSPKKTGLNCGSMTCPTGGAPNINYGKNNYGKTRQSALAPCLQKLWKKKGSDHFRDILNPYGEKSNYGKIGRRRRLSKLNVFFSIILSVTIYTYTCIYVYVYLHAYPYVYI